MIGLISKIFSLSRKIATDNTNSFPPLPPPQSLRVQTKRVAQEKIDLHFIDTSSKLGHGSFQTTAEKKTFYGPVKKDKQRLLRQQQQQQAA